MEKDNRKNKDNQRSKFSLIKNKRYFNGLLLVCFTAILFFITIHKVETNKLNIKLGDIAPDEIRATKEIIDEIATNKLKKEAVDRVEPKYRITPSVQMTMKNTIKDFLDIVRDLKSQDNISFNKKVALLKEQSQIELSQKELYIALRMDYKGLNSFENTIIDLINQIMGNGIREDELDYEKENIKNIFETLKITEEEKKLGLALFNATIQPNKFIDIEATERKKEEEAGKIEPVIIKEHQVIARKGDKIDQHTLELIKESGLLKNDKEYKTSLIIGVILLLLLILSIMLGYIYYFNRQILFNNQFLIFLIIILLTILISEGLYNLSPYIMPVSTGALLVSILIDPRLALMVNLFISFILGFVLKLDTSIIAMFLVGGSIGALMVIKQQQRYNILINGLLIGFINILTLISFTLIKGIEIGDILTKGGYSLLNGMICGILTIGTLPIWENTFAILTPLKLLELSNPNQPLLKKLLLEAPGTYHHSVLVGNLSEAAAEAIDANPLIVRVGSYYHDIGKTKRPYYFKENQFGMDNPHDKLQPMQSTQIITSHTLDGIALGKEHKLPTEILDIIEQHHGNTAVVYFYHKARELNKDMDIDINEFRYKGKKPQTKEAALVMLADSTEAAVRSIKGPTKEKIEEMVKKVVKGKLDDGQLDECDVTLKEINIIINSFIKVLIGIFHDRIEYPTLEANGKEES
ncbi:HDIG domain-containing protein [Tissierella sp. MSJ-40]|uniref:HDIG domain-containing protein n=1 Tax=Tissierella simiarum TaxID=2841534 RepID=A0ABS6E5S0_9FIRM|nr:HDIG domain-containing metalloprotein [Tissierella simiarum]MBU5438257.1 HDIG domain-containing protein [Tissierella simiarum]